MPEAIYGALLAGGVSSRLGLDKTALRLFGPDGPELALRSALLLRRALGQVLVVGRELAGFASTPDDLPGRGPLGGLSTALRRCPGACLALACDLPFMDLATLRRLLAAREEGGPGKLCTAFVQNRNKRVEYLAAVYEPEFLPLCLRALEQGRLKLGALLPPETLRLVPYAPEESLPFFNVNTPEDLEKARRLAAHFTSPALLQEDSVKGSTSLI